HERIAIFAEHIAKMGTALGRTVEAFNGAAGAFETRVLPTARRLEDLGAAGKKPMSDVAPINTRPRPLLSPVTDDLDAYVDRGKGTLSSV
ncbi:MAG: hypothetical protein H7X95_12050, partial [Deltaproteobacteria bacterium]|nr:hypothetical protein [Deltaproteobacteria bacterium]